MKTKLVIFIPFFALVTMLSINAAEGAGVVKVTFKYRDSLGSETALDNAYLYLHDASRQAPMERFFSSASYVLGPSNAGGTITAGVPEGEYYVRVTRRKTLGGGRTRQLGPPEAGDYTWFQTETITVSTNVTTDLGTKYADFFGTAPITVSGAITKNTGEPVPGRFIRVQTEPCISANYADEFNPQYPNYCGPIKFLAEQPTDANGRYVIHLRDPGTYYIYEAQCLGDKHKRYVGNPACIGTGKGPVTLQAGDDKTVDIVIYSPYY